MASTYDLRGDYADATVLPSWAERGVVVLEQELDFTAITGGVDAAETVALMDIPAGTTILAVSLTVDTAETTANSSTISIGVSGADTKWVNVLAATSTGSDTGGAWYTPVASQIIATVGTATIDAAVCTLRVVAVPNLT